MRYFHIYATTFFFPLVLLFAISGLSLLFGVRQDTGAKIKEWVLEKPLKKEQAERFELYPINDYQYVAAEIKVKDEEYLVYETTCYDILKGKFDLYNSLKDINPPLNRIIKLKGVILVDKLGEYKTQSYYFDISNFDELNSGTVDHLIYQIKSTIKLEKKD